MNKILSRIYFMMHSFSRKVVWMLPQRCNSIWNWNLRDAFVNFLSLYNFQFLHSLSSLTRPEVSIFDALSSFSIFSIRKIHFVLSPTSTEIFKKRFEFRCFMFGANNLSTCENFVLLINEAQLGNSSLTFSTALLCNCLTMFGYSSAHRCGRFDSF